MGNYYTSPVLRREQTGSWMIFAVSGVSGSHCPFPVRWLSHSQPSPFVFGRNKAQKTTKLRSSLQFNFLQACDQLGENKGRATFFTMKTSNPSDNPLMWKSRSSVKTVQFCEQEGLGSCRKGGKFSKLFLTLFSQSLAELLWSFWSCLGWKQSFWHSISFYTKKYSKGSSKFCYIFFFLVTIYL